MSVSTGVRDETSSDSRIIRMFNESEKAFIESLKSIRGGRASASSSTIGGNSANSGGSPAGTFLPIAGGVMNGLLGLRPTIIPVVSNIIDITEIENQSSRLNVVGELSADDSIEFFKLVNPGSDLLFSIQGVVGIDLTFVNQTATAAPDAFHRKIRTFDGTDLVLSGNQNVLAFYDNGADEVVIVGGTGGTSSTTGSSIQLNVFADVLSDTTTQYLGFGEFGQFSLGTEVTHQSVVPVDSTLQTISLHFLGTSTITSGSFDVTIRRNGGDLSPTKKINVSTVGGPHVISGIDQLYSAGDLLTIEFAPVGSPVSILTLTSMGIEWNGLGSNNSIQLNVFADTVSNSVTEYLGFGEFAGGSLGAEGNRQSIVPVDATLKTLYLHFTGTITSGSFDITVRRAPAGSPSADLSPTKTINVSAVAGPHIISNIDQLYSAGDLLTVEFAPVGSPVASLTLTSMGAEWNGGGTGTASFPLNYPVDRQGNKTGTVTHDLDLNTAHKLEFTATGACDITISNIPTSAANAIDFYIEVTQDNPGLHAITFNDAEWDPIPVFGTAADTVSLIAVHADGDGKLRPVLLLNATITVAGATTELDNLGTTSINADLTPQAGKLLGSDSVPWSTTFSNKLRIKTAGTFTATENEIIADAATGMEFNTPTGDLFSFFFNAGTASASISVSQMRMNSGDFRGTGLNLDDFAGDPVANGEIRRNVNDVKVFSGGSVRNLSDVGTSNLPVVDTTSIVEGSSDATKEIRFEVDGLTTSTIRVITPPDADINLAGTNIANTWSGIQTFGNDVAFDAATHDIGDATNHVEDIFTARVRLPTNNAIVANAHNIGRNTISSTDTTIINVPTNEDFAILENGVSSPRAFSLDMSAGIMGLDDPLLAIKINASDPLDISKAAGTAASFISNDGFDFSGGDVEFNDNSLTGVNQIDYTTTSGTAVASIIAVDSTTDRLDINLDTAANLVISDNGTPRLQFNNTVLTWDFLGTNVVKLPPSTEISDRTSTPSAPSSGQAVLYVFDDGTAQPNQFLRIRFANGEIKTIADDIP